MRAVSQIGKKWPNGRTITIAFLGGSDEDQKLVKKHAVEWTKYANLTFEFKNSLPADIRISFNEDDGAWSYVGTDNLSIPTPGATMNLGWVEKDVILHEFGHMIGLSHEHQNPDGGIQWNEAAVIESLSGSPNFWDEATIRHNVLNKYSVDQVNGTEFDPESIMLYAFPGGWTHNMPGGTQDNPELSDTDKAFIASAKMYPGKAVPAPVNTPVELPVMATTPSTIQVPGEADMFTFDVVEQGEYIVETTGGVDVVMSIFGPDNSNALIAENDDGGSGTNARVQMVLSPGTYSVKVRAFSTSVSGSYSIHVLKNAA